MKKRLIFVLALVMCAGLMAFFLRVYVIEQHKKHRRAMSAEVASLLGHLNNLANGKRKYTTGFYCYGFRLGGRFVTVYRSRQKDMCELWSRDYWEAKRQIADQSSPPLLRELFYACVREEQTYRVQKLSSVGSGVYRDGQFAVLSRLAEIGTAESTKLLVDIFLDKAVAYEGREADMFGFLITVCGEKGVPFLERVHDGNKKKMARDLVKCIETDRFYPFTEGCAASGSQGSAEITPYAFMQYVRNIDLTWNKEQTRSDVYQRLHGLLKAKVEPINSVPLLQELFYSAYNGMELALWDQMSSQEQQESSRTAFRYAQYAVLARLAGIKTDQSARLLVDILKDKSVRYDGEAAEARYDIILQCGKPCLPYLEQIEDKDPCKGEARDLIKGIKEANP